MAGRRVPSLLCSRIAVTAHTAPVIPNELTRRRRAGAAAWPYRSDLTRLVRRAEAGCDRGYHRALFGVDIGYGLARAAWLVLVDIKLAAVAGRWPGLAPFFAVIELSDPVGRLGGLLGERYFRKRRAKATRFLPCRSVSSHRRLDRLAGQAYWAKTCRIWRSARGPDRRSAGAPPFRRGALQPGAVHNSGFVVMVPALRAPLRSAAPRSGINQAITAPASRHPLQLATTARPCDFTARHLGGHGVAYACSGFAGAPGRRAVYRFSLYWPDDVLRHALSLVESNRVGIARGCPPCSASGGTTSQPV